MEAIKETLLLNLAEDIKDVINVEDHSEKELRYEVENYIVTNKIADHLGKFAERYQENVKETGVWLSGFYGSGKSYFGKMLGYLLENKDVEGTSFRERFIQRLEGVKNQSLLENAIRGFDAFHTRLVFLDIAKQSTTLKFPWTLFKNFIRSLGFLDDVFGYMEYQIYLEGGYSNFEEAVERIKGEPWKELRRFPKRVPKIMREVLTDIEYSENDYTEMKKHLEDRMSSYGASHLKEELSLYLEKHPNERIVFIIDEVSEALSQKKIDILELEGVSEALSDIEGGKVWTIAISQEKFDDVINNTNVSRKELNKIMDRFQLQIPLSSEEVDTVIRKRLLMKKTSMEEKIRRYYSENNGLIVDSTSLSAKFPTRSENPDDFAIYYPFHEYQFHLLQNFLFSVHEKAKTGGSERGMIIATHNILKRIKDKSLFAFVTAADLVDGGKKLLESALEIKFSQADKILKQEKIDIDGGKLLKTVYFLTESELVRATAENVTKLYLDVPDGYYDIKPQIEEALESLCATNLLLEKNGVYKITSDLEQKIIDEMKNISIEFHYKKRELIDTLKKQGFIKELSTSEFEKNIYQFSVISAQGDELVTSSNKHIKIRVVSPYTLENREEYIDEAKFESQNDPSIAILVPSMSNFQEIDRIIEEVYKYNVLEDRYKNDDDQRIRTIIQDFSVSKRNKTDLLERLIDQAYKQGTMVYQFEEHSLTDNSFNKVIAMVQGKIIDRTYTDRLSFQLAEEIGLKVLKETNPKRLRTYFEGQEYPFFDDNGAFIGDSLRVVEKIVKKIDSMPLPGKEILNRLSDPPCGYAYGTISTVLAVLLRTGRLSIKSGGHTIYDYKDSDALKIFSKSREFDKASFKAITTVLSSQQKQQLVDNLKGLKAREILTCEFGYNTNDIELVSLVGEYARHYVQRVEESKKLVQGFRETFPTIQGYVDILSQYDTKITDTNYKDKAEAFIEQHDAFREAAQIIEDTLEFTETKLPKIERYLRFVEAVQIELGKVGIGAQEQDIIQHIQEFEEKYKQSVVQHFVRLETICQQVKDGYYALIKDKHDEMSQKYQELSQLIQETNAKIEKVDAALNNHLLKELNQIHTQSEKHICTNLKIEHEVSCLSCHYSLNEIIAANQNVAFQRNKVEETLSHVIYPPKEGEPEPFKTHRLKSDKGRYTVAKYKKVLEEKRHKLDTLDDDDIILVD